jgi:DNA repair protein SbcD/Mre11
MRLVHTSDWHLGRTLHGVSMLAHQAAFLEWLLGQAVSHQADAVVVAGDIYDRAVPCTDAVAVLDRALRDFAAARIPVVITSGNHDSAVRLGFGARLSELAGIHLRTSVADITRPVVLSDADGEVAIYGIPYLLPDAVMEELGAQRSHQSVLTAAVARIRADAAGRGISRTVVAAHAFVTGALPSDSERDIRVGGIGDAPASVFDGVSYVALGHLHGQQNIPASGNGTTVRYSGSPLAFSFSERNQDKSVTLADIDAAGRVTTVQLAAPVPRPLREVCGKLGDLLGRADGDLAGLAAAWVKVVLTDTVRPASPMERLREKWPHTLVLEFAPEGGLVGAAADLARLAADVADPVRICGLFVEFTGGGAPDEAQRAVLQDVVEACQHAGPGGARPPVLREAAA